MSNDKNDATFHGPGWPASLPAWDRNSLAAPTDPPGTGARPIVNPGPPPWAAHTYDARPSSTVAVWALVTGVIGVLAGWCMFGIPSIAAMILGHIGVNQTRDGRVSGRGMAVAGLVLGYVAFIPAMIFTIYMIIGGFGAAVTPPVDPESWPSTWSTGDGGLTTSP